MQTDFVRPAITLDGFNCPHCGAYAHQQWCSLRAQALVQDRVPEPLPLTDLALYSPKPRNIDTRKNRISPLQAHRLRRLPILRSSLKPAADHDLLNAWASKCAKCEEAALWIGRQQIWPAVSVAPNPHPDMPEGVRSEYMEARAIMDKSPRAAAALLRLAVEGLCDQLGAKGKRLFDKIGHLVSKGLPKEVRDSLDAVRITAGDAMHTGQIRRNDDRDVVDKLFEFVNFIVQETISRPRHIAQMQKRFSEDALKAIEERDTSRSSPDEL